MRPALVVLLLVSFALTGCVSVSDEPEPERAEGKPIQGNVARAHESVDRAIERMKYQQGKELLGTMQQIIAMKELAKEPVVASLSEVDDRTRANLIYVLGYIGGNDAHDVIASHLGDASEGVRFEAAAALMGMGDWSAVPVLLHFMDSENRHLRYKAHQSLVQGTKQDFGYVFDGEDGERSAGLTRWKNWWTRQRAAMIYTDN
jgi:hypothetical protein